MEDHPTTSVHRFLAATPAWLNPVLCHSRCWIRACVGKYSIILYPFFREICICCRSSCRFFLLVSLPACLLKSHFLSETRPFLLLNSPMCFLCKIQSLMNCPIDIYANIGDSLLLNLQHEVPGFEVEFLGGSMWIRHLGDLIQWHAIFSWPVMAVSRVSSISTNGMMVHSWRVNGSSPIG